MSIMDAICYIPASYNLFCELPEDGTDVPKHVGIVKYYAFQYVCNLGILLVL
jgi:hypothetical protein